MKIPVYWYGYYRMINIEEWKEGFPMFDIAEVEEYENK